MKHIISFLFVLYICFNYAHTASGGNRSRNSIKLQMPSGMKYIPSGRLTMLKGDVSKPGNTETTERTIQLSGFYMDETEITNGQYRDFTNYVRDSIANVLLGNFIEIRDNPSQSIKVEMKKVNWGDPAVQAKLSSILNRSSSGSVVVNASSIIYNYTLIDKTAYSRHPNENYVRYISLYQSPVYPDTTIWGRYSGFNDPVVSQYFCSRSFNDYPVLVSMRQSIAYCNWRTNNWQAENNSENGLTENLFRLPTEEEWEWAAKGGSNETVPFLQPVFNSSVDGSGFFSSKPVFEHKNSYGLLNMDGNVSEWTTSQIPSLENTWYDIHFMEPGHPLSHYTFIARGGSWANSTADRKIGVRTLAEIDSTRPYIGFRCVFTQLLIPVVKKKQ